jgi:hypothetical protein
MSQDKVLSYAGLLEMSFAETLRVAGLVPEPNRCLQLEDGRVQPTWLIGHLANTLNAVVNMWMFQHDNAMPKGWGRMFAPDFAGGNPPTCQSEDYPPWDDVVDQYRAITQKVLADIRTMDDSALGNPLPGDVPEALRQRFSTIEQGLKMMVVHDNYHRGQLGLLAKLSSPQQA